MQIRIAQNGGTEEIGLDHLLITADLRILSIAATRFGMLIEFAGTPGQSCTVEWAPTLDGRWRQFFPAITIDSTGLGQFEDTSMPMPLTRFYRIALFE